MMLKYSTKNKNITNWNLTYYQQVVENVSNLINLVFNELPINRQVGVSRDFLYKRADIAKLDLFREIERNIRNYEPRAIIKSIDFKNVDLDGNMDLLLDIEIKEV